MRMWALAASAILLLGMMTLKAQRPFREYPGVEYNDFPLPDDYAKPSEWVFARLMYPPDPYSRNRGFGFGGGMDWKHGYSIWTQDYPRADRHFNLAVRRLTRIDSRSVEQPVDLDDDDDVFNWPWLYAVQVGRWKLTDSQAAKLREYLDRGGFFMVDDFWGSDDWEVFERSIRKVYADRPMDDLPRNDQILHTVFDLSDLYQVPGARYRGSGVTEKCYACPPAWRGMRDPKGRVNVAATFDSDLGDSWEYADDPSYDEKFSALGIRIAVNYIAYAMTH